MQNTGFRMQTAGFGVAKHGFWDGKTRLFGLSCTGEMRKYGLSWPDTVHPAAIELEMIRHGGRFQNRNKDWVGESLPFHYQQFARIVWPEKEWHKWNILLLEQFCSQRM